MSVLHIDWVIKRPVYTTRHLLPQPLQLYMYVKPWSHVRDCRPRLSTTEQMFAIFWQSYSVLRESYGCRSDTYWTRTDSRSVVGSLGDATTVLF